MTKHTVKDLRKALFQAIKALRHGEISAGEAIAMARLSEIALATFRNDFYAEVKERMVTIIVDGTPHEVPQKEEITYAEVVTLAYPDYPQHPEITYSVTYTHGPANKPEGTLAPGGSVKVKEGMSFRVNRTGQS